MSISRKRSGFGLISELSYPSAKRLALSASPGPVKSQPGEPESDPFRYALQSMCSGQKSGSAYFVPEVSGPAANEKKPGTKPRKRVTWAPDGELESIRLIAPEVARSEAEVGQHLCPHKADPQDSQKGNSEIGRGQEEPDPTYQSVQRLIEQLSGSTNIHIPMTTCTQDGGGSETQAPEATLSETLNRLLMFPQVQQLLQQQQSGQKHLGQSSSSSSSLHIAVEIPHASQTDRLDRRLRHSPRAAYSFNDLRRRKACTFFAVGRCRFGEDCWYAH
ncbi:hypothetical protein R3P38DRAFT_3134311 [Favolaschia claudopus]|uniref:C3H1-type domain-containing protein n=1 Tax=Favolaschia claudopus TaxID=2862362 RepID=A0AAV9Z7L1_9AGAR